MGILSCASQAVTRLTSLQEAVILGKAAWYKFIAESSPDVDPGNLQTLEAKNKALEIFCMSSFSITVAKGTQFVAERTRGDGHLRALQHPSGTYVFSWPRGNFISFYSKSLACSLMLGTAGGVTALIPWQRGVWTSQQQRGWAGHSFTH